MMRRITGALLAIFMVINLQGCASLSGSAPKEPKLFWNVSYIRGVVLAREALNIEQIKFENALVNKDAAQLRGNYPDGRGVEIIISNLKASESSLVVRVNNSPYPKEESQRLLELIAKYAQQRKQTL